MFSRSSSAYNKRNRPADTISTWRVCDDESDALKSPPTNTVVYVPKHKFSLVLNRKKQKYVCVDQVPKKCQNKGFMDKYLTLFRPQTPPGMCRIVENHPIGKWVLTIYKKKRIYVSIILINIFYLFFITSFFVRQINSTLLPNVYTSIKYSVFIHGNEIK